MAPGTCGQVGNGELAARRSTMRPRARALGPTAGAARREWCEACAARSRRPDITGDRYRGYERPGGQATWSTKRRPGPKPAGPSRGRTALAGVADLGFPEQPGNAGDFERGLRRTLRIGQLRQVAAFVPEAWLRLALSGYRSGNAPFSSYNVPNGVASGEFPQAIAPQPFFRRLLKRGSKLGNGDSRCDMWH
jgi:hypothetical protein